MPSALSVFPNRACASVISATYSGLLPERAAQISNSVIASPRSRETRSHEFFPHEPQHRARCASGRCRNVASEIETFRLVSSAGSTRSRKWLQDQFLLSEPGSLGEIPPGDIKWVGAMSFRRNTEESLQTNRERQAHNLRIATMRSCLSLSDRLETPTGTCLLRKPSFEWE